MPKLRSLTVVLASLRRAARSGVTLLLCFALTLAGCSSMGGLGQYDDPTDPCRPERQALVSTGKYFAQDILAGAAVGAIGGAAIGAVAGGDARSALFGALAGGALGALGGYWAARERQYSDQAQLYRTVYGDIERDNHTIDQSQAAFNRLTSCRRAQAARIRADLRAGRITHDQAVTQMADVRRRAGEDLQLAQSISGKIRERGEEFSVASTHVQQRGRTTRGRGNPAAQVQAATSTNLAKRDQFQQAITRAQATQSSFELS